jgi:hypothetical protein
MMKVFYSLEVLPISCFSTESAGTLASKFPGFPDDNAAGCALLVKAGLALLVQTSLAVHLLLIDYTKRRWTKPNANC